MVPSPHFQRPVLAVASYSSPPGFSPSRLGHFFVPFPPDDASAEDVRQRLENNSHASIPTTAVHEAYPGHHWHLVTAKSHPSPLRRTFRTPYFSEGWALYAEHMMREQGFFEDPRHELFQVEAMLFRAARIVVDTSLHAGDMTLAEAQRFMEERANLTAPTARAEVARYAAWPTQASAYLVGCLEILAIRERHLAARRRDRRRRAARLPRSSGRQRRPPAGPGGARPLRGTADRAHTRVHWRGERVRLRSSIPLRGSEMFGSQGLTPGGAEMSTRQGKRAAIGFDEIVGGSAAAGLLDVQHSGRGAGGRPAADAGDAARRAERRPLRLDPERGHGMGPARARAPAVPHPLDPGRHPRARRPADRPRLPHRPLGGGPPDGGGRRRAAAARVPAVRRLRHRPLRRPDPGHGRDDGQPALPERRRAGVPPTHPVAPDAARRPGHRHVRQGPARDDDGARGECATCPACSSRAG